jgi:hypothetical protein
VPHPAIGVPYFSDFHIFPDIFKCFGHPFGLRIEQRTRRRRINEKNGNVDRSRRVNRRLFGEIGIGGATAIPVAISVPLGRIRSAPPDASTATNRNRLDPSSLYPASSVSLSFHWMLLSLRFWGTASTRSLFLFATSNMMMRGLGSVRSSHASLRPSGLNTTELSACIEPNASTKGARAAPIAYQYQSVCRESHWLPSCHGFVAAYVWMLGRVATAFTS